MSSFVFLNLVASVRNKMISEIEMDIANENLYFSNRLNEIGIESYPSFLKNSVLNGAEDVLESLILNNNCLLVTEFANGRPKKVPTNAAKLIAQSEFNRSYIRAVCLEAIENNIEEVEVYRARYSTNIRPESEAAIGLKHNPKELLEDLRDSIGIQPKILPHINSGLSVKF